MCDRGAIFRIGAPITYHPSPLTHYPSPITHHAFPWCASCQPSVVSHPDPKMGGTVFRTTLLAAALVLGVAETLPAQGWVDVVRRPTLAPTPVVRVSSNVRTRVEGRVATIEVEEQFRNYGGGIAEG